MEIVVICDAYDWTYEEYMNQPSWFIALKNGKRRIDNEMQSKKNKPKAK